MARKEFKSGLDVLLQSSKTEQPISTTSEINEDAKNDFKEVRATFIVNEVQLTMLKAFAYWDRKQIKEILFEAIDFYFKNNRALEIEEVMKIFINK